MVFIYNPSTKEIDRGKNPEDLLVTQSKVIYEVQAPE